MTNDPVSERHKAEIKALVDMEGGDRVRDAMARAGYLPFVRVPRELRDEVLEALLKDLAGC